MFSDTLTFTVNGVAKVLQRINQDQYSSEYLLRTASDEVRLRIRNTSYRDKRANVMIDRHNVELVNRSFGVIVNGLAQDYVRKSYFVMENQQGDSLTDPINHAAALCTFLTQSSNATLAKLVNFES